MDNAHNINLSVCFCDVQPGLVDYDCHHSVKLPLTPPPPPTKVARAQGRYSLQRFETKEGPLLFKFIVMTDHRNCFLGVVD